MKSVRNLLLVIAVIQFFASGVGVGRFLLFSEEYFPIVRQMEVSTIVVLCVVGAVPFLLQTGAIFMHLRVERWLHLGHALAGLVTAGSVISECVAINSFFGRMRCGWG